MHSGKYANKLNKVTAAHLVNSGFMMSCMHVSRQDEVVVVSVIHSFDRPKSINESNKTPHVELLTELLTGDSH